MKTATRKEAFELTRRMLETGEILTEYDLTRLVRYFAPPVPAKPKTAEDWLSRFVSTDPMRQECMQHMYSDGESMWATNGAALAWIPTQRPKGYYEAKTVLSLPIEDAYVPVDKVMPQDTGVYTRIPSLDELEGKTHGSTFIRCIEGLWFDQRYLAMAISPGSITVQAPQNIAGAGFLNECVKGENKFGNFVLMAMREAV